MSEKNAICGAARAVKSISRVSNIAVEGWPHRPRGSSQIHTFQIGARRKKIFNAICAAGLMAALSIFSVSPAWAQSSVTLGGFLRDGIQDDQVTGATSSAGAPLRATALTDATNFFYIAGQEDLGGGIKTFFRYEQQFDLMTGQQVIPRNVGVGLEGPWGKIAVGRWSVYFSHYWYTGFDTQGTFDAAPDAANALNVLGSINGAFFAGNFFNNTIRWELPKYNGFSGILSYSFDTGTAGAQSNHLWYIGPTYTNGSLRVGYYHLQRNDIDASTYAIGTLSQRADRFAIGYDLSGILSGLRLNFVVDQNYVSDNAHIAPTQSRIAYALPLSYTRGVHMFAVTYGQAFSMKLNGSTVNDTGARMFAASYQYSLSKRTAIDLSVVELMNQKNGQYGFWLDGLNGAQLPTVYAGARSQLIYAGIRTSF